MYHMASTSKPNGVILHTPWTLHHLMESDVLFGNIRLIVWVCSNCIHCILYNVMFLGCGSCGKDIHESPMLNDKRFHSVFFTCYSKCSLENSVSGWRHHHIQFGLCHSCLPFGSCNCLPAWRKTSPRKNPPLSEPTGIFARKTFDLELFNNRTKSSVGRGTESVPV